MNEVMEFFRNCPACGRRFHIKLVSKNLIDERKVVVPFTQGIISPMLRGSWSSVPAAPLVVEQNIPITIDVEDFKYSYKCKHCGHEWSETHTEQMKK